MPLSANLHWAVLKNTSAGLVMIVSNAPDVRGQWNAHDLLMVFARSITERWTVLCYIYNSMLQAWAQKNNTPGVRCRYAR